MLRNLVLTLCLIVSVFGIPAFADEASTKAQIQTLADRIVQQLPKDKKVVLKTLSSERTGLPADFLRKLAADVEAALLSSSESSIRLSNRLATEDVWSEANEFNNTAFEELYKASNAQIMLLLSARATKAGIEMSISAYGLEGESVGTVLASTGTIVLKSELENAVGVDVTTLNEQMNEVIEKLDSNKKKIPPRADVMYKRYMGDHDVSEDGLCPTNPTLNCTDDTIVAIVNGKRFEAFNSDIWDQVFFQGDIDNDGFSDVIVQSTAGGNGFAPTYTLVSYRGEGRFQTHELEFYDFNEPTMIEDSPYWIIRGYYRSEGVGNTDTDDRLIEYRFIDGDLKRTDGGQVAPEVSVKRFTSEEAIKSLKDGVDGYYSWDFELDRDSESERLECSTWIRWGLLTNCTIYKGSSIYEINDKSCKVIAVHSDFKGINRRLTCDGEDIELPTPVQKTAEAPSTSVTKQATSSDPILIESVYEWDIYDNRHVDSTCYASLSFPEDRQFFIVRKLNGNQILAFVNRAWASFTKGRKYELTLLINNKRRWSVVARSTGKGFAVNRLSDDFVLALAGAKKLTVGMGNRVIAELALKNTSLAVEAVNKCLRQ